MVRSSSVLSILTWKCASRHNGVHFFMSHLASWLRTRRFSEPTFRPSGATNHWKNTVNRDFPIFSRIYLFFLLIFSLLSASSLLCVSTVHIVGSLASKLPSTTYSKCNVDPERTNQPWVSHVGQLITTGRQVEDGLWGECLTLSRGYPTLTAVHMYSTY